MPRQIQLEIVLARLETQALEETVELVDRAGKVPVDEHLGLSWLHEQAQRRAQVEDRAVAVVRLVPLIVWAEVPGIVEERSVVRARYDDPTRSYNPDRAPALSADE